MIAARGTHATVIPLKSGIHASFRTLYLCDEAPRLCGGREAKLLWHLD